MTTIELRLLGLSDLRAIEEIERRSYPTPTASAASSAGISSCRATSTPGTS
jgi:hypothetical protein